MLSKELSALANPKFICKRYTLLIDPDGADGSSGDFSVILGAICCRSVSFDIVSLPLSFEHPASKRRPHATADTGMYALRKNIMLYIIVLNIGFGDREGNIQPRPAIG